MTGQSSGSVIPVVSSLPANPTDGQEVYWLADATNGVMWRFRYNGTSASAYKWEFVGGPPLYSEVTTAETTTSTTFAALATAGPAVVVPLAGDFNVDISFYGFNNSAGGRSSMSYDIGGTGAVQADMVSIAVANASSDQHSGTRARVKTLATASTLTAKYQISTGSTGTFSNRWMRVLPVRVG